MSDLKVSNLRGRTTGSAPNLPNGAVSTGIITATSFDGNLTGNVTGDVTGLSGTPDLNIGIASATQFKGPQGNTAFFYGDGSGLINVNTSSITGINIKDSGNIIGVAGTVNFGANLDVSPASAGIVTVTNSSSTRQIIASGTLANGDVVLNSDGTVSSVSGVTTTTPASYNNVEIAFVEIRIFSIWKQKFYCPEVNLVISTFYNNYYTGNQNRYRYLYSIGKVVGESIEYGPVYNFPGAGAILLRI